MPEVRRCCVQSNTRLKLHNKLRQFQTVVKGLTAFGANIVSKIYKLNFQQQRGVILLLETLQRGVLISCLRHVTAYLLLLSRALQQVYDVFNLKVLLAISVHI